MARGDEPKAGQTAGDTIAVVPPPWRSRDVTALRGNRVIQLALLRARPCAVTMTPAPFPQCCPRPGSTCGDTSCPRQSSLASSGLPTGHLCDSPFQSPLQGPDALALSVAGPLMCAQKMGPLGLSACPSRSRVLGDLAGVPRRAQGSRDLGSARPSCTAQSGP